MGLPEHTPASLAADCSNPDMDASFVLIFAASISYDFVAPLPLLASASSLPAAFATNLGKTLKWLNTLENTLIYRVYHAYVKYVCIEICLNKYLVC